MSELPLKATLKAGKDFDAPWLTVDGANPEDLKMKLDMIVEGAVIQSLIEAANALKAANNAAPLLAHSEPVQHPAAAPAPVQNNWGQSPQQQAPAQQPQQQGFTRPATTHPEGKACEACGSPLEYKKTSSGKGTWRCPAWRWNNGSPNEHTQLWA